MTKKEYEQIKLMNPEMSEEKCSFCPDKKIGHSSCKGWSINYCFLHSDKLSEFIKIEKSGVYDAS